MNATTIYKLLRRTEWEGAQADGVYRGSAHDARDGFMHFSTAPQLAETARKYFTGVVDLVLLTVDVRTLLELITPHPGPLPKGEGAATASLLPLGEGQDEGCRPIRWEPSRGGDLFPHLYAALPIAAVKAATPIPLDAEGIPIIPSDPSP